MTVNRKEQKPLPKSTAVLVADLETKPKTFDRDEMIRRARRNKYHDFLSDNALNSIALVQHLDRLGYKDLAENAKQGKYDATREESDEWAKTPEGQATFAEFGGEDAAKAMLDEAYGQGGIEAAVKAAVRKVTGK